MGAKKLNQYLNEKDKNRVKVSSWAKEVSPGFVTCTVCKSGNSNSQKQKGSSSKSKDRKRKSTTSNGSDNKKKGNGTSSKKRKIAS